MFPGAQRYRRFDQLGETAQWVLGAPGLVDYRREILGDALIEGGPDQVSLGGKPAVEGSLTDARTARDGLHRCVGPEFGVDVPRRTQYALDVACCVRPQWPLFNRGHGHSLTDS